MMMKKIEKSFKTVVNFFKSLRISTIYKTIGILLFIGILIWIVITITKINKVQEKNSIYITGTVINKGENYIIIKDSTKNEYLIQGVEEENYTIGSDVSTNINEVVENGNEEKPTTVTTNDIEITYENKENKNADTEIMTYMNETENYFSKANFQEEVKTRFIAIVDFLFYNGKIKGYTFDDLTSKAKLQVLKLAISVDNKIESYLPGYKESIASTSGKIYTGIKNKVIESYLTITTKICNYDKSLCDSAIHDFQDMKKAFSITWQTIKSLISTGAENLTEWYEIYSGKKS